MEQKKSREEEQEYLWQSYLKGSDKRVERRELATNILALLGKLGGRAHAIVAPARSGAAGSSFVRWDPEKRVRFTLPLVSQKVDVYFDSLLPRLVDLA